MQKKQNNPVNVASFSPKGDLGVLFNRSKKYNQINDALLPLLPKALSTIRLSSIIGDTACFVAFSQPVAYRARQQEQLLLKMLRSMNFDLSCVKKIKIKVSSR
jgi:hypothetical protein